MLRLGHVGGCECALASSAQGGCVLCRARPGVQRSAACHGLVQPAIPCRQMRRSWSPPEHQSKAHDCDAHPRRRSPTVDGARPAPRLPPSWRQPPGAAAAAPPLEYPQCIPRPTGMPSKGRQLLHTNRGLVATCLCGSNKSQRSTGQAQAGRSEVQGTVHGCTPYPVCKSKRSSARAAERSRPTPHLYARFVARHGCRQPICIGHIALHDSHLLKQLAANSGSQPLGAAHERRGLVPRAYCCSQHLGTQPAACAQHDDTHGLCAAQIEWADSPRFAAG